MKEMSTEEALADPKLGPLVRRFIAMSTHDKMSSLVAATLRSSYEYSGESFLKSILITVDLKPCACGNTHPLISLITSKDDPNQDAQMFLAQIMDILNSTPHPEGH